MGAGGESGGEGGREERVGGKGEGRIKWGGRGRGGYSVGEG